MVHSRASQLAVGSNLSDSEVSPRSDVVRPPPLCCLGGAAMRRVEFESFSSFIRERERKSEKGTWALGRIHSFSFSLLTCRSNKEDFRDRWKILLIIMLTTYSSYDVDDSYITLPVKYVFFHGMWNTFLEIQNISIIKLCLSLKIIVVSLVKEDKEIPVIKLF